MCRVSLDIGSMQYGTTCTVTTVDLSRSIAFHCVALHCIALRCIALRCIALQLQCNAMQCNAKLHCVALHCIPTTSYTAAYRDGLADHRERRVEHDRREQQRADRVGDLPARVDADERARDRDAGRLVARDKEGRRRRRRRGGVGGAEEWGAERAPRRRAGGGRGS